MRSQFVVCFAPEPLGILLQYPNAVVAASTEKAAALIAELPPATAGVTQGVTLKRESTTAQTRRKVCGLWYPSSEKCWAKILSLSLANSGGRLHHLKIKTVGPAFSREDVDGPLAHKSRPAGPTVRTTDLSRRTVEKPER